MADNTKQTADKTAWQQENELRYKELTDKLAEGIQNLFSSDKYKDYLKSMSHFHNYSSRNVMLIHQQLPGATRVASFKTWKEKFNRSPKRGEKSLRIFAPIERKPETKLMEKLDPQTGAPMLDKDGNVIMEEMTALNSRSISFKLVPVFDVSQTVGEPLPQLAEDLTGNVEHYEAFLDTLKTVSPLPIVFEPMKEGQDGYCRFGEQIGIREGMSEIQTVSAIIHEITHAKLHDKSKLAEDAEPTTKSVKEIEAESVSYVVCQKYGIETGGNSFGYLASWGSHDLKEVQASLDTIRKEANDLINAIDSRFMAICKERGIDLSGAEQTAETSTPSQEQKQDEEKPVEPTFTTTSTTENIAGVDFTVSEVVPNVPLSVEQQNYQKLDELFPQITNGEFHYQRSEAGSGFMPLSLEWTDTDKLSIMHTYTQNGDLMYDPMIVFEIDKDGKTATAVEFQQSNPPLYQVIVDGVGHSIDGNGNERTIPNLQAQLNDFSTQWFENIGSQGYMPERAGMVIDGDDVRVAFDKDGKLIMPEPTIASDSTQYLQEPSLPQEPILPKVQSEPMPDPTITAAERDAYGYTTEDILPLNAERATELFNNDHAVFLLYSDNTEAMVFDVDEIKAHDGIFGIEREDWQKSQEYRDMSVNDKTNQQQEAAIEYDFINAKEDKLAIYQIMDGAEKARDHRFEGLDGLERRGLEVNRNNYVIVHTEPLQEGQTLEGIFQKFNLYPPQDFSGHSLSVSDVVALNQGGEITSHYVDSFGFSELPAFLGVEKQAEIQTGKEAAAMQSDNDKPATPKGQSTPEKPDIADVPKSELPIYRFSIDHAMQTDETKSFHESSKLNAECGRAIDAAISASNYEMYRYDLKAAAREVVDEFGADRVAWVLASNVNDADYDGRLSNKNKAWAKEFNTPTVYLQTHKSILDGFVDRFRAIEKEKPSLMSALDAGEKKSKAEFDGKAKPGLDAPDVSTKKKNTGMEV